MTETDKTVILAADGGWLAASGLYFVVFFNNAFYRPVFYPELHFAADFKVSSRQIPILIENASAIVLAPVFSVARAKLIKKPGFYIFGFADLPPLASSFYVVFVMIWEKLLSHVPNKFFQYLHLAPLSLDNDTFPNFIVKIC